MLCYGNRHEDWNNVNLDGIWFNWKKKIKKLLLLQAQQMVEIDTCTGKVLALAWCMQVKCLQSPSSYSPSKHTSFCLKTTKKWLSSLFVCSQVKSKLFCRIRYRPHLRSDFNISANCIKLTALLVLISDQVWMNWHLMLTFVTKSTTLCKIWNHVSLNTIGFLIRALVIVF